MMPLLEILDNQIFYKGTRFRIYNVGLNVKDKTLDFHEYMLVELPGDENYMLLTCVDAYKSGSSLALVKKNEENGKTVNGKSLKFSLGVKDTFVLEDEYTNLNLPMANGQKLKAKKK